MYFRTSFVEKKNPQQTFQDINDSFKNKLSLLPPMTIVMCEGVYFCLFLVSMRVQLVTTRVKEVKAKKIEVWVKIYIINER